MKIIHFFRKNDTVIALAQEDMCSVFVIIVSMLDFQYDRVVNEWSYKEWVERDKVKVRIETFFDIYNNLYRSCINYRMKVYYD